MLAVVHLGGMRRAAEPGNGSLNGLTDGCVEARDAYQLALKQLFAEKVTT
jgi:hypothetical protein